MATRSVSVSRGGTQNGPGRSINAMVFDYKAFTKGVRRQSVRIMREAAELILAEIIPLTPLDTGALRESGRAKSEKSEKGVRAVISFGGYDAPVTPTRNAPTGFVHYAAVVNYDATRVYNVGGPFFLERGVAASKKKVDAHIVRELKKIK